jgi:ATP-dependent Clp protease ATP-binding subunit ClpA
VGLAAGLNVLAHERKERTQGVLHGMDYYNLFSFSAKKAIYRASEICAQFNNQYLEPEHIFYAILNIRSASAVQILHQLSVNLPKLVYSIEAHLYEHKGSHKGSASFSARTLQLLDASFKEIKRLHHREIGTTHLLIALAQDRSPFLRTLFDEHSLDAKKIRDSFMGHLRGYAQGQVHSERSESALMKTLGQESHLHLAEQKPSYPVTELLEEARRQARAWRHGHIEPAHLLAALGHLYPDRLRELCRYPNVTPAALAHALLSPIKTETVLPERRLPLSPATIDMLCEALRCALQGGRVRIAWQDIMPLMLEHLSSEQRGTVDRLSQQGTEGLAQDPMSLLTVFDGAPPTPMSAEPGAGEQAAPVGGEVEGAPPDAPPGPEPDEPAPQQGE